MEGTAVYPARPTCRTATTRAPGTLFASSSAPDESWATTRSVSSAFMGSEVMTPSEPGHPRQVFRVPIPLHGDLRGGAFDLAQVVRRQVDGGGSDVLLEPLQLPGSRDGHDPWLPGEQPGERDLSRCRLLPFRDPGEQVDQGQIRLPSLRREARHDVAEIGAVERRALVDLPREEALAQRAEGDEADPELLECRQHFRFRASPPQRVLALECRHGLDRVGATDRLRSCLGKAEVLDLAFPDQVLHRTRHVFDRHVPVDPVLIEEIDGIDSESLERGLGDLLDVLWPAVQAQPFRPPVGIELEPELGGYDHLP